MIEQTAKNVLPVLCALALSTGCEPEPGGTEAEGEATSKRLGLPLPEPIADLQMLRTGEVQATAAPGVLERLRSDHAIGVYGDRALTIAARADDRPLRSIEPRLAALAMATIRCIGYVEPQTYVVTEGDLGIRLAPTYLEMDPAGFVELPNGAKIRVALRGDGTHELLLQTPAGLTHAMDLARAPAEVIDGARVLCPAARDLGPEVLLRLEDLTAMIAAQDLPFEGNDVATVGEALVQLWDRAQPELCGQVAFLPAEGFDTVEILTEGTVRQGLMTYCRDASACAPMGLQCLQPLGLRPDIQDPSSGLVSVRLATFEDVGQTRRYEDAEAEVAFAHPLHLELAALGAPARIGEACTVKLATGHIHLGRMEGLACTDAEGKSPFLCASACR